MNKIQDGVGGLHRKGNDSVAINGFSCGETAGWRCDRKVPLLGGAALHGSTPYVGDKCVRTRCVLDFFAGLVNVLERVIWGGPIMMASYLIDLVEGSLARP